MSFLTLIVVYFGSMFFWKFFIFQPSRQNCCPLTNFLWRISLVTGVDCTTLRYREGLVKLSFWRNNTRQKSNSLQTPNYGTDWNLLLTDPQSDGWNQDEEQKHILNGTCSILLSASMPPTNLPNMLCFPSRVWHERNVMKNCDLFELGPELAMLNTPRPECVKLGWNQTRGLLDKAAGSNLTNHSFVNTRPTHCRVPTHYWTKPWKCSSCVKSTLFDFELSSPRQQFQGNFGCSLLYPRCIPNKSLYYSRQTDENSFDICLLFLFHLRSFKNIRLLHLT